MKATSIEQSRKLLELGLSPETADMHYSNADETDLDFNHPVFDGDLAAWSLEALLELIPLSHNLHGLPTEDGMVYRLESFERMSAKTFESSVEAVYDMIVWLLENERIKH